jgi:hypothetical protein
MLDNLPPLDLPRDLTRSDVKPAAASPAESEPVTALLPAPVEPAPEAAASAIPAEVSVAPGLKRFAALEPKLAGGSVPSADGLDWLVEKGYKTLVDLREPASIQSSFLEDVSRHGLRYVSLPISLTTVDRDHVARFEFEISLAEARPLYFFDTDGNRAGILWYVHRMTDGKESYDAEEALRQAGEIGLVEESFKKAAQTYIVHLKKPVTPPPPAAPAAPAAAPPPRRGSLAPASASASAPTAEKGVEASASVSAPPPEASPASPSATPAPEPSETIALPDAATLDLARAVEAPRVPTNDNPAIADPNAWRPYLALVFAALGVPVAYCGRSLIQFRGLLRASLPAPARRLRSLPGGSGE